MNFSGREVTGAPADDFTIIAMPDTQYYSASFPATYISQTQWIVDNRATRNIAFVTQLGDCVDKTGPATMNLGETGQFTTATDKMTGETVKIDVTLTVMK